MVRRLAEMTYRGARRIVVAVVGSTLILIGLALLVLPGPGTVVLVMGLAVLSIEFVWARRLLRRAKDGATSVFETSRGTLRRLPGFRRSEKSPPPAEDARPERSSSDRTSIPQARAGE